MYVYAASASAFGFSRALFLHVLLRVVGYKAIKKIMGSSLQGSSTSTYELTFVLVRERGKLLR